MLLGAAFHVCTVPRKSELPQANKLDLRVRSKVLCLKPSKILIDVNMHVLHAEKLVKQRTEETKSDGNK